MTVIVKKTSLAVAAAAVCLAVAAPVAWAKLPAPPEPTPEAKAKAAETAARTAWTGKMDAYKLCMAQDRAVENYRAGAAAAGKQAPAGAAMPACTDPGPFAFVAPQQ
ncbi:MAG: hypothetical protein JSS56_08380 [Proteobacteria bacterium]|nr:hypothetical protein [Pseudomonadota bacterium]